MESMIAIIDLGGKQHLVSQGARVVVNRLATPEGDILKLPDLLSDRIVQTKVVSHTLGKKVNGLKFKAKTRSFKRYGHRQQETLVEVVSIEGLNQKSEIKSKQLPVDQLITTKKVVTTKKPSSNQTKQPAKKVANVKA